MSNSTSRFGRFGLQGHLLLYGRPGREVPNPALLERALIVSGEKTKKAAVTKALTEFIARREQERILQLFDKLEWNPDFDYKTERSRR